MSESTYDVVLLVEQPLTRQDADQVRGLHTEVVDPVLYHVLLPVENASGRVESSLGSLVAGEASAAPAPPREPDQVEADQRALLAQARSALGISLQVLRDAGADAEGDVVTADPVEALGAAVTELGASEAIVLTRPHLVAELLHRDWTSRARRHLGVPLLHLLEHETFDEQSGGAGEGATGL